MAEIVPGERIQVLFVGSAWARTRRWVLLTTMVFALVVLALSSLPPIRLAIIVAIDAAQLLYVSSLRVRIEGKGPTPREAIDLMPRPKMTRFFLSLAVANGVVVALTGGLEGPMTPHLIGPVVVAMSMFGRARPSAVVLAGTVLITVAVALIPAAWQLQIAQPYYTILSLGAVLGTVGTIAIAVMGLSDGLTHTGRRLHDVYEDVLEGQSVHKRNLETVGAKVAHELKNPLAAVKGLLQLERGRAVDERSKRRFEVMAKGVARMETILHDYLSFARPFEPLHATDVDLKDIVEDVVDLLEGRATSAGVVLRVEGQAVPMRCDPVRMREALLNLASNAVEATAVGGVVTLRTDVSDGSGRVSVEDTGVGMTAPVLERVGTPFFTTRTEGTGLGIALARSIISQHGGDLSFESAPELGTTARIVFPSIAHGGRLGHDTARG